MHARLALFFVFALGLIASACTRSNPDRSYAGTAQYRYELGQEALESDNFLEAIQHFTVVKNKFAYSKFAALAELRIGDAYFDQAKYIEAIDVYRAFEQRRPNHEKVPYAVYRAASAYFEQRPSDFFLFPPSHEKDLGTTKDALRVLQDYVRRFPDHESVKSAKERIVDCRRTLVDHELYVARFYLGQSRPVSARPRLEAVVRDFEDVEDRWLEGGQTLVDVLRELGEDAEAQRVAGLIIRKHPASDVAESVRNLYPNM